MKPESYREQHVNCCGTCKHLIEIDGLLFADICGFGEDLDRSSFEDAENRKKLEMAFKDQNWVDTWVASHEEFLKGRDVNPWDICDQYEKQEAIA